MATYIYCRVSPKPDEAKQRSESIETQQAACLQYCASQNLAVSECIIDRDESAASTKWNKRPGGKLLLAKVKRGDIVVCYRLDRIFRNLGEGLETIEYLEKRGVKVYCSSGQRYTVERSDQWLMLALQLMFATYEAMLTAERTSDSMLRQQANGKAMSAIAPYGWKREGKHLIEDEDEQATIAKVVELADEGLSPAKVMDSLTRAGIMARTGKPFHRNTIASIIAAHKGRDMGSATP